MGRRPPHVDPAEAVRLYDSGMDIRDVAKTVGASYGVVQRVLKEHTALRPPGSSSGAVTVSEVQKIITLHEEGLSAGLIAEQIRKARAEASPRLPRSGSAEAMRREVGAALRGLRKTAGFTLGRAARILECDVSKISRMETGTRGIRSKDLRELLAAYDAESVYPELAALLKSAKDAGRT